MLKTLIGDDAFRRGMDLYFARCDGTAATVEDFLAAFARCSGQGPVAFRALVCAGRNAAGRRHRPLRRGEAHLSARLRPGDPADTGPGRPRRLWRCRWRSASSRRTARRCRPRCDRVSGERRLRARPAPPTASLSMTCRRVRSRRCSAASRLRSRSRSIFRTTTSWPCCGTTAIRSTAGKRRRRSRCASWCGLRGREATSMTRQGGLPVALARLCRPRGARRPGFRGACAHAAERGRDRAGDRRRRRPGSGVHGARGERAGPWDAS